MKPVSEVEVCTTKLSHSLYYLKVLKNLTSIESMFIERTICVLNFAFCFFVFFTFQVASLKLGFFSVFLLLTNFLQEKR